MTTPSQALELQTKEDEIHNGVEELLSLLDPMVVNTPGAKSAWQKLDHGLVFWLTHTVSQFPWLPHLALASVIYSASGTVDPDSAPHAVNTFLRWAIPEHYPNVSSLEPVEALIAYFGDPPQRRGNTASKAYSSLQLHMQAYLRSLPAEECTKLSPFLFPILIVTPQLSQLRRRMVHKTQEKRKEQAFAVVKDLHALIMLGRRRYQWLAELDVQVQQIVKLVVEQQITLPTTVSIRDLDNRQTLTFRVWNRMAWIKTHQRGYSRYVRYQQIRSDGFFLQLVGALPEDPWFLRAAELGAFSRPRRPSAHRNRQYFQDCNVRPLSEVAKGLIHPNAGLCRIVLFAQRTAHGTLEDSRVVFCLEPLLAAAAVGLFALVCLTQSGMRMGELQQISGDKECIKIGNFPIFDGNSDGFSRSSIKLFFWHLYPKGSTARQPYPVTPYMQEALKVWLQVHERFCGPLKEVSASSQGFTHARRFPGKHKFVLQWNGRQLIARSIEACVDLLLLEHLCLDAQGKRARVTAHVLRHAVAGHLRQQGVPIQDIAALLHQVNLIVTDYYSKPSPQDLFAKVGPLLTRLGELAEIDPSTLRSVGDIQKLGQAALKRYGVLRHIPGGTCAVFTSCEVQFKCASCPSYIPDPTRAAEVREKISSCARTVQFLHASGDYLEAEVQKVHGRNWERIVKEMQAMATIELASPPFESALKEFGIDNLDEVDDEWLLSLKQHPRLSPGGNQPG